MPQKKIYLLLLIFFYYPTSYAKIPAVDFYYFTNKTDILDLENVLQCVVSSKIINNKPRFLVCLKGSAIKQTKFKPIDLIAFDGHKVVYWTYSKPLFKTTYQQILNDFFAPLSHPLIKKIISKDYFNQCIGNITQKDPLRCGKVHPNKTLKDIKKIMKTLFKLDLPQRTLQVEKTVPVLTKLPKQQIEVTSIDGVKENPKYNHQTEINNLFKNPWLYLFPLVLIGCLFLIKKVFFSKIIDHKIPQKTTQDIQSTPFIFAIEKSIQGLKQASIGLKDSFDFKTLNETLQIEGMIEFLEDLKIEVAKSTANHINLKPHLIYLSNGYLLNLFRGQALVTTYYPAIDNWWLLQYSLDRASLVVRDLFFQQDIQLDYVRLLAPMDALEGIQINHDMRDLSKIHHIQLFFEQSNYHQANTFPVIDIATLGYKDKQTDVSYPSELIIYNPAEWR